MVDRQTSQEITRAPTLPLSTRTNRRPVIKQVVGPLVTGTTGVKVKNRLYVAAVAGIRVEDKAVTDKANVSRQVAIGLAAVITARAAIGADRGATTATAVEQVAFDQVVLDGGKVTVAGEAGGTAGTRTSFSLAGDRVVAIGSVLLHAHTAKVGITAGITALLMNPGVFDRTVRHAVNRAATASDVDPVGAEVAAHQAGVEIVADVDVAITYRK